MKNQALLLISFGGNLHNFFKAKPENWILKDKDAKKLNTANKALFQKKYV